MLNACAAYVENPTPENDVVCGREVRRVYLPIQAIESVLCMAVALVLLGTLRLGPKTAPGLATYLHRADPD
jgi:hypothetical protein